MRVFKMANADEKAPEGDESGVKEGSDKGPEADNNKDKGSKELEKKYGMTLDELKAKADELDKLREGGRSELEKLTGNLANVAVSIEESSILEFEKFGSLPLKLSLSCISFSAQRPLARGEVRLRAHGHKLFISSDCRMKR